MLRQIDYINRIEWKEYAGSSYLHADFRDLNDPELLCMNVELNKFLENERQKSVLLFVDITGLKAGVESFFSTKKYVHDRKKYVKKIVAIGLGKYTPFYSFYEKVIKSGVVFYSERDVALKNLIKA